MKIKKKTISFIIIGLIILAGIIYQMNTDKNTKVLLETNYGNITLQLRGDMPITSGNFKSLVEKGTFNGVVFHRIINGFMIQGGDPTGTRYGDNSIPNIKDEFRGVQKNNRGTIAMANAGPNTGSSQFFINLVNNNFLDNKHPVFGEVIEGMDVVDKIGSVETNAQDRPIEEIIIIKSSL